MPSSSPFMALLVAAFLATGLVSLTVPPSQNAQRISGAKFVSSIGHSPSSSDQTALQKIGDMLDNVMSVISTSIEAQAAETEAAPEL